METPPREDELFQAVEGPVQTRRVVLGIVFGALLGALALKLLFVLPNLLFLFFQFDLLAVTRELRSTIGDAFTTPWGAIGALIGGTMAWNRLRAQQERYADSWRVFYPGEAMLAWGFACLLSSFGMYPSVLTWLLALYTLPLAIALLLFGAIRARASSASASEQFAGFGLLLLGIVALGAAAMAGTNLSYRLALPAYNLAHEIQQETGPLRLCRLGEVRADLPGPSVPDWSRTSAVDGLGESQAHRVVHSHPAISHRRAGVASSPRCDWFSESVRLT